MFGPVVALMGRPNVGKSTLFNCLLNSRAALVADAPGLTRDRRYGDWRVLGYRLQLIDTAGCPAEPTTLGRAMEKQTWQAVQEADLVLYLGDAQEGLTADDQDVLQQLRVAGQSMLLIVNKMDGVNPDYVLPEFNEPGAGQPLGISSTRSRGIQTLKTKIIERLIATGKLPTKPSWDLINPEDNNSQSTHRLKVAMIGRPNTGKSTLINQLLKQDRVVIGDAPGTTHDSIFIPLTRAGKQYTLVDTAGIRRRSKINQRDEGYSVAKSLESIKQVQVAVLLIDASEGLVEQDLHLLGYALRTGCALVIAVNKWDVADAEQRSYIKAQLDRRLRFATYVTSCFISALRGAGLRDFFKAVDTAGASTIQALSTVDLNKVLAERIQQHPPPIAAARRRIKLNYAHLGGRDPLVIIIHGNQVDAVPDAYRRYLENGFRQAFGLHGMPIKIEFKGGKNPYANRKNALTTRQINRRKRLMQHVKRPKKKV